MEYRTFILAVVDGFREGIGDAELRTPGKMALQPGLQRVIKGYLKRCHGVDLSPARGRWNCRRGRAYGRVRIEQAPTGSATYGCRVDVETERYTDTASPDISRFRHPAREFVLHRQVVRLRVAAMEGVCNCGCARAVGQANHTVTIAGKVDQHNARRKTRVGREAGIC